MHLIDSESHFQYLHSKSCLFIIIQNLTSTIFSMSDFNQEKEQTSNIRKTCKEMMNEDEQGKKLSQQIKQLSIIDEKCSIGSSHSSFSKYRKEKSETFPENLLNPKYSASSISAKKNHEKEPNTIQMQQEKQGFRFSNPNNRTNNLISSNKSKERWPKMGSDVSAKSNQNLFKIKHKCSCISRSNTQIYIGSNACNLCQCLQNEEPCLECCPECALRKEMIMRERQAEIIQLHCIEQKPKKKSSKKQIVEERDLSKKHKTISKEPKQTSKPKLINKKTQKNKKQQQESIELIPDIIKISSIPQQHSSSPKGKQGKRQKLGITINKCACNALACGPGSTCGCVKAGRKCTSKCNCAGINSSCQNYDKQFQVIHINEQDLQVYHEDVSEPFDMNSTFQPPSFTEYYSTQCKCEKYSCVSKFCVCFTNYQKCSEKCKCTNFCKNLEKYTKIRNQQITGL